LKTSVRRVTGFKERINFQIFKVGREVEIYHKGGKREREREREMRRWAIINSKRRGMLCCVFLREGGGGRRPRAFLSKLMLAENPLGNTKTETKIKDRETKRDKAKNSATDDNSCNDNGQYARIRIKKSGKHSSRKKPVEDATTVRRCHVEVILWKKEGEGERINKQKAKGEIKSLSQI
jgi:hypothetical protein